MAALLARLSASWMALVTSGLSSLCGQHTRLRIKSGLRIRIHLIRIRIQHFRLNTHPDPDPGGLITKNWRKKLQKKNIYFFGSKTIIYLSIGLLKGRPSYKRSLQLSEENIQHFKTWDFLFFSSFVGHFSPPRSGSGFRLWIRIHWPDWIRIRLGSGSATLVQIPEKNPCRTVKKSPVNVSARVANPYSLYTVPVWNHI